jgi:hypothetical protein
VRLSARSRHVLSISGLLRILETYESEDEAIRSFAAKAHTRA